VVIHLHQTEAGNQREQPCHLHDSPSHLATDRQAACEGTTTLVRVAHPTRTTPSDVSHPSGTISEPPIAYDRIKIQPQAMKARG